MRLPNSQSPRGNDGGVVRMAHLLGVWNIVADQLAKPVRHIAGRVGVEGEPANSAANDDDQHSCERELWHGKNPRESEGEAAPNKPMPKRST